MGARRCKHYLPNFRTSCLIVCLLYVVLAASLFAQGLAEAMAAFAVPPETLASPHYLDALLWVYTHTFVLGLVVGVVGITAESPRLKLWFARLMVGAHLYYLYLDTRSSDSVLGNGLYQGSGSLAPAIIVLIITALFIHLSQCTPARALHSPSDPPAEL